ncbi:lysine-specific demethylase [Acrasis kona]|uniref:Lysine-specific demethylase n=1 Tax=Acrasis kona TaxID=1008807 RepID=A0AAW2YX29_9EUKA
MKRKLAQDDFPPTKKSKALPLYCKCKQPYVDGVDVDPMIACDMCDNWFHLKCMKISEDQVKTIAVFVCSSCERKYNKSTQYYYVPTPRTFGINDDYQYKIKDETYIVQPVSVVESEPDEQKRRPQMFYLNQLALAEDDSFRSLQLISQTSCPDPYQVKLIYKLTSTAKKPIGYFTFAVQNQDEAKGPCLRQIFFVKSERRKGHASRIINYFMKGIDFGCQDRYIESPNENMCKVLCKEKYASMKEHEDLNGTKISVEREIVEKIESEKHADGKNVCAFVERIYSKNYNALIFTPLGNLNFDTAKTINFVHNPR